MCLRTHAWPAARPRPASQPGQPDAANGEVSPDTARHSTGILGIPRTVLRAASTAVAECSCTGMTRATGSPQLDNTIETLLSFPPLNLNFKVDLARIQ